MTDKLTDLLSNWLNDWLTHWLTKWLNGCWLCEWLTDFYDWPTDLADLLTEWLTILLPEWMTCWPTYPLLNNYKLNYWTNYIMDNLADHFLTGWVMGQLSWLTVMTSWQTDGRTTAWTNCMISKLISCWLAET